MTAALALGATLGLGLFMAMRALVGRGPALVEVLAGLERLPAQATPARSLDERVGRRLVGLVDVRRHGPDLRVTGRSPERLAFEKLAASVAGALVPALLAALVIVNGVAVPVGGVVVVALVAACGGFVLPDLLLRRRGTASTQGVLGGAVELPRPGERRAGRRLRHRDRARGGRRSRRRLGVRRAPKRAQPQPSPSSLTLGLHGGPGRRARRRRAPGAGGQCPAGRPAGSARPGVARGQGRVPARSPALARSKPPRSRRASAWPYPPCCCSPASCCSSATRPSPRSSGPAAGEHHLPPPNTNAEEA